MQRSIYKNSRMSSAIIPVYNLGQTYVRNVNPKKFEQNMILKLLKSQAETAIREKKTFTVCGNYYAIRRALLSRGWVEKIRLNYNTYDKDKLKRLLATSTEELLDGMRDPQNGYIYERVLLSKLLGNHQVDFYWDQHNDCFKACRDSVKLTLVNKFKRGIFNYTSKQGLCESMKRAYWFQKPGFAFIRHPRSYNLSNNDEPKEFINDYKLTAAMCLLKWIVHCGDNNQKIIVDNGKVSLRIYRFACNEVSRAIRKCRHEDIDFVIEETMNHEWDDFLECYYKIVHYGNSFKSNTNEKWMNIVQNSKTLLQETEKYWPHLELDGMFNIWILKPTNGCRGEGIHLCRTLEYIFKIIRSNSTRRYIVQKYIEKPLLIYNTKFDIRQWFLISNADPLTVWIYKDCYIRFSSQLYNLHKLNEAIHLTNNSVQCRYKNCRRNSALPSCNMWDSKRFQKYLSLIGQPNVFYDTIYPGMKESLVSALLTNQYNLDTRKNCFELYGTDFMLTEDYKPWLIEINSRPALFPSTPVTARMCPQVLEDLIKVVIDNEKNPMALTGNFELLYKEKTSKLPTIELEDLKLKGEQLPPTYFYNPDEYVEPPKKQSVASQTNFDLLQGNIKQISLDMRKTLENLLSVIQVEREKRTEHRNEQLELIIATKKNDDIPNNMNNSSEKNIITLQDTKFKNSGSSSKSNFSINQNSEINLQKEVSYITTELVQHTSTEDTEEIVKIEKPLTNYNSSHSIFTGIIESIRNFSISYKKCIPRI